MFNPAAAISQVVAGNLGPSQFFTVVAGEMVGAFIGGLTIYILYMPQLYKAGAKVFAFKDLKEGLQDNKRYLGQRGSTVSTLTSGSGNLILIMCGAPLPCASKPEGLPPSSPA